MRDSSKALAVTSFLLASALSSVAFAEADWPSWRGPNGDGTAASNDYPTEWSESKNVVWKVDLPGLGSSTPAVVDGRLFLTHEQHGDNRATCLDGNGQSQWSVSLGKHMPGKHKKATGCNPSPVTDGKHVYFYFKSGDLACLTLNGETVWRANLQDRYGENTLWWDLGTSPVLTNSNIVVAVQQEGPSFVVALDKTTGELAWKQDRTFQVPDEAEQSYTTPVVTTVEGNEQIIVLGADHITAHDAADGKELWRVGDLNPEQKQYFRSIASPTLIGDVLVAPYARGATLNAVRLGGTGDVTDSHGLWLDEGGSSDVPTPANLDGNALICTDKGVVRCLESATGSEVWSATLPKHREQFSSSPVVAGSHIYLTREEGTTFVLDKKGELVAKNELPLELCVATPVFVSGSIYVRGLRSVYCIGE